MKEIQQKTDVEFLVDSFYAKVRKDDLLGPVFEAVIDGDWGIHMAKMYSFWETVLLGTMSYKGNPFLPHAKLSIKQEHFDRWLQLFEETLDQNFMGKKAEEAKWRANNMAVMFSSKLAYYQSRNTRPLI